MTRIITFAGHTIISNTLCIICIEIFDRTKAPRIVAHETDGSFWVTCGDAHPRPTDYKIVGFGHVSDLLPTAEKLPLLRPGEEAEEISEGTWRVKLIDDSGPPPGGYGV